MGIGNKFYSAVDKVEETRKRLIDDRIIKVSETMSNRYRYYMSKIKRFTGNDAQHKNVILEKIRNKIKEIRKNGE